MPEFIYEHTQELKDRMYVVGQDFDSIAVADHQIWRELYRRQESILKDRASEEWYAGMQKLAIGLDGIPNYDDVSDLLEGLTGWRLVAVPGLVPDDVFFTHLANRRFPVTNWIRNRSQMDYIVEPDAFHDLYGHVPHLADPLFADYLEHYGREGLKAIDRGTLHHIARLYWYTVEFGLIRTDNGLRIYGAGITSSTTESIYSLEGSPGLAATGNQAPDSVKQESQRVPFDLERVMRTNYIIHTFQSTYFVIESYDQLREETRSDYLERVLDTIEANPYDYAPYEQVPGEPLIPANSLPEVIP